jgi:catechol 2,3-dioxygenase-like lactoylglutathione lyase family enzyme
MTTTAVAAGTRFRIGLFVSDVRRSAAFYRALFGNEPAELSDASARFEVEAPALTLSLFRGPGQSGGALNHVGMRLADTGTLLAIQQRLEEAGIATQSEEDAECCYARATKFWAPDPDGTLWELYTLEADIDHSGFEDLPSTASADGDATAWPGATRPVVYKGPFARVVADDGTVYYRGEKQTISARQWLLLRSGPERESFTLLAE